MSFPVCTSSFGISTPSLRTLRWSPSSWYSHCFMSEFPWPPLARSVVNRRPCMHHLELSWVLFLCLPTFPAEPACDIPGEVNDMREDAVKYLRAIFREALLVLGWKSFKVSPGSYCLFDLPFQVLISLHTSRYRAKRVECQWGECSLHLSRGLGTRSVCPLRALVCQLSLLRLGIVRPSVIE
jgi:hypothetical protein